MDVPATLSPKALAASAGLALLGALGCTSGGGGGNGGGGQATAPTITQQPSNQATTLGRPATFTVAAAGAASYQWQAGTTDIPGATSASYTLPAATQAQNGATYRALAVNAAGTTASNPATLTVNPLPTFTVQPAGLAVTAPAPATFTATATGGTAPLAAQWQRNGVAIPGATAFTYTLTPTSAADNGAAFRVQVADAAGATATSAAATLQVAGAGAPVITQQPASTATTVGRSATFTVTATGAASYQWQAGTTDIPGATAAAYTLPAAEAGQNGATFRVLVTNTGGTTTSAAATLTVNPLPGFGTQPAGLTLLIPAPATFTATTTGGTPPFAYQWRRNGTPIPGATAATYVLPATSGADDRAVFAVGVVDAAGATALSAGATLRAVPLPAVLQAAVMLRPMTPVDEPDRANVLALRAQLEGDGYSVSPEGALVVWPESPAAGWRVDLGAQHATLGVDGSFTLDAPGDGAQVATLTHASDRDRFTQVSLALLAKATADGSRLVIPWPYHGPCGMTAGEEGHCGSAAPEAPAAEAPAFSLPAFLPGPPLSLGPNDTCSPPLLSNNAARQVVYTPSPDGIRGSYLDPAVIPAKRARCVINDGYLTDSSIPDKIRYFGSTCNIYVKAGACPNENAFSDVEYVILTEASPFTTLKNLLLGNDDWIPAPAAFSPTSDLSCEQNHKKRNCAMICLGDVSVDFPADAHLAKAGDAYATQVRAGGAKCFVVHNNGVYGFTKITKVKDDIGGSLSGPGLAVVNGEQEVRHFRPTTWVAKPPATDTPTDYITDENLTYSAPPSAPAGAQAIYRFMVDNQQVTITFVVSASAPNSAAHALSTTALVADHAIGTSPCPQALDPITLTNTGCDPLSWSVANPMSFITLDVTSGTLPAGGSVTLHPAFPCSGFVVGANTGTLTFTVQNSASGAASTGPTAVSVSLTVH